MASNALLASVLLAIAFALTLSAWLPQAPDSITDPMAFSRWLSETQTRFGGSYTTLKALGVFSLTQSTGLHGLAGLAALCLLVRTANSIHTARHSRRFQPPSPSAMTGTFIARSLDDVAASLQKQHYRILRKQDIMYADRFPLAHAGQLAIYLGGLLIIGSLAISSVSDWRAGSLTLSTGQVAPINAHRAQLYTLRLDSLDSAGRGQVTLLKETETVGTGYVTYSSPVALAGLTFSMNGTGPAIRASASMTNGLRVPLQAAANDQPVNELVLQLTHTEPDHFFAAPEAGLVVRLSEGPDMTQPVRAQVYRSKTGALLFDDHLPADGLVHIESTQLSLHTEQYIVIDVVRSPSRPVAVAGMSLLVLGLVMATFWPFAQFWAIGYANGSQFSGDAAVIQDTEAVDPLTWRARLAHAIPTISWKIGLAVLTLIAVGVSVFNLRKGDLTPTAAIPLTFLAAWLAGCALAILNRRLTRWVIVLLALIALTSLILEPQQALLPIA